MLFRANVRVGQRAIRALRSMSAMLNNTSSIYPYMMWNSIPAGYIYIYTYIHIYIIIYNYLQIGIHDMCVYPLVMSWVPCWVI